MNSKLIWLSLLLMLSVNALQAQDKITYTLKADSVKITGCDSSELIIENHTQGVKGFLYNTGNGRTIFKNGIIKLNDSQYVMGADTFKYKAWVQGGNTFGTTGKFGTLDNNHIDFYTHDSLRMRLSNYGRLMLGTTADNGDLLQVHGRSTFSDSVHIGSATITNTGNLIGTNALLYQYVISKYHNFRYYNDPYIGRLENIIYNHDTRFNNTYDTSNGVYTIDMRIPASEIVPGYAGLVYPQGFMTFSFWNNGIPAGVTVSMKDSLTGGWMGPWSSFTNIGSGGAGFFQIPIPGNFNWVCEIKVVITPQPGMAVGWINMIDMEYVTANGPQGLANPNPYVSKDSYEHLYLPLYFRSNGDDNIVINPWGTSYFSNKILMGTRTDNNSGATLQVAGGITSTGNVSLGGYVGIGTGNPGAQLHTTGTVRFEGITNNSSTPRVVTSDVYGNLYYRDISSLVSADAVHSSLVVNGPVKAKSLTLESSGKGWPDYVFDSTYQLTDLRELGAFVRTNRHLPGIASATEITRSGINVGESQAALLKKIEELTLYAVRSDEQLRNEIDLNRRQGKEMQMLKKELGDLKKIIAGLAEKKEEGK